MNPHDCVPCKSGEHATIEPDENGIERCTCCGEPDPDQQGTVYVHANGVEELDPADDRATVCGTCGRAWNDSVSTAVTPVPAGRCPFEYEHPDEDAACNTCGGTGKWETTLEDDPTTLVPLGPCPDCSTRPEPSPLLVYRISDDLVNLCDEQHITLPERVLENLVHTIAVALTEWGAPDDAR